MKSMTFLLLLATYSLSATTYIDRIENISLDIVYISVYVRNNASSRLIPISGLIEVFADNPVTLLVYNGEEGPIVVPRPDIPRRGLGVLPDPVYDAQLAAAMPLAEWIQKQAKVVQWVFVIVVGDKTYCLLSEHSIKNLTLCKVPEDISIEGWHSDDGTFQLSKIIKQSVPLACFARSAIQDEVVMQRLVVDNATRCRWFCRPEVYTTFSVTDKRQPSESMLL